MANKYSDFLSSNRGKLVPAARLLAGAAGGALALTGLKRRDKVGAALGGVGLGLLATSGLAGRGLTDRFRRSSSPDDALPVEVPRDKGEVPVQGTEEGVFQPTTL
jgi:hypothetical protein